MHNAKAPVSIIIPCYNCAKTIALCLSSLENQSFKPGEIIVVDDASTDNSLELARGFGKMLSLKIIKQKHSGPAAARNLGAKKAKNSIIVFLDSDCIAPSNWLGRLLEPIEQGFSASCCPYRTKNSESFVARYVGYEIAFRHEKMLGKRVDSFGSYSAAFVKKDFSSVGGFDESFSRASGEDFALTFALHDSGKRLFFTGSTFVWHFHPESLLRYLRQQFLRGYWRVPLYLKNSKRAFKRESYSGFAAQSQFFLSLLLLFSIPLSIALWNFVPLLFAMALLLLSNASLGAWCFSREKKFVLLAPILASMRSVSGATGALAFLLSRLSRIFNSN